jgi:hypothetical protein
LRVRARIRSGGATQYASPAGSASSSASTCPAEPQHKRHALREGKLAEVASSPLELGET